GTPSAARRARAWGPRSGTWPARRELIGAPVSAPRPRSRAPRGGRRRGAGLPGAGATPPAGAPSGRGLGGGEGGRGGGRGGRAAADAGAVAAGGLDHTPLAQVTVGRGDRGGGHRQFFGQCPYGRKRVTRGERAQPDAGLDAGRDRRGSATLDLITY